MKKDPRTIETDVIEMFKFAQILRKAMCASCEKAPTCQVGIMHELATLPEYLDVYGTRRALLALEKKGLPTQENIPRLWCLLPEEKKHTALEVLDFDEHEGELMFTFRDDHPE